jgi:hypothetical protein
MTDFKLDGEYEHVVQSTIVFTLNCTRDGKPVDAKFPVEAFLKGAHDEIRGEVNYTFGKYSLQFHARTIGLYEMHVKINNKWLYKDSDIVVNVTEKTSKKYVDLFFEFDGNLLHGNLKVGTMYDFLLYVKNVDGSGRDIDLSDLEIKFGYGSNFQRLKPKRIGNGTYHTETTVELPGVYPLDIHYEGKSVIKEVVQTRWTGTSDPKNTKAIQVPTRMLTVGEEASFVIQSRNKNDLNNVTGGDIFDIRSDGPTQLPDLVIRDKGDGKYVASFTPTASGVYQFHITLNGVPIGNSPVSVSAVRR